MKKQIKILLVEDSVADAKLIAFILDSSGMLAECQVIKTIGELRETLSSSGWDLILSDNRMPGFDAFDVLELAKQFNSQTPCIIMSGVTEPEQTRLFLKNGAVAFLDKDHLDQLPELIREIISDFSGLANIN